MDNKKRIIQSLLLVLLAVLLGIVNEFYGGTYLGENERLLAEEGGASQNTPTLVVTYLYDSEVSDISRLDAVEKELNEITLREIGAEVDLLPVDLYDSYQDYMLWLSRGDTIDLMYIDGQSIQSFVDTGLLQPLNTLLKQNATYLYMQNVFCDQELTIPATYQGSIYGIAGGEPERLEGYGIWVSLSRLEELEISYRPNHIYTLDEIGDILEKMQSRFSALTFTEYTDKYPLGLLTAKENTSLAKYFLPLGDSLGSEMFTGMVFDDSDVVENPFEKEEYHTLLQYLERWYQEKYIYPDGIVYAGNGAELLTQEEILMIPGSSSPDTMEKLLGEDNDYVCLQTVEATKRRLTAMDGYWVVPVTANYKARAMEFLDLIYADPAVANLLTYGVKNEDYTITDLYGGGITRQNGGFYNPIACYGSGEGLLSYLSPEEQVEQQLYENRAKETDDRYAGFVFNTSPVSRQIADVTRVVQKYVKVLESGSVDVEENYQDFLTELKEAGQDEIIAEKQRQLDRWLERQ